MKRFLINSAIKAICRDEFRSSGLRRLYNKIYDVEVGMYSYGCFDPVRIPPGTKIGRYCSIARTAHVFNANHPIKYCSLHPFFYNVDTKFRKNFSFERTRLVVEDDVWLGHNSTILANVTKLGRGCIVGAGAVVTSNVPPYAIVGGVPAKILGYRFEKKIIDSIERTMWWELDEEVLKKDFEKNPDKYLDPENYFS